MSPDLEPMQRLFLWSLAISPNGGMLFKDMRLTLAPAGKRKFLEKQGLTRETGRPIYVELTEAGWMWCQEHLAEPLNTRSPRAQDILHELMRILAIYFKSQDQTVSIGQMIQQARHFESQQHAATYEATHPTREINDTIKSACLQLGAGSTNVRVRLSSLRSLLPDFSRHEVDRAILAMERNGELTAMRLDNPDEINSADRDAVLHTPSGSENHILYLQGLNPCQSPL